MTKPDPHLASRIHLRAPVIPPLQLPDFDAIAVTMPPLSGIRSALRQMAEALRPAFTSLGRTARTFRTRMEAAQNTPGHVEGQAALYRTRAALDPTYSTPEALQTLVSGIMRHPAALSPDLAWMSPQNRAYVATSALTGWVRYHAQALPPLPALTFGGHAEHHIVRRHDFTIRAGQLS